jgi:hypothetical protein
MTTSLDIMQAAGWKLVRQKKHCIWQCPCGKHQVVVAKTPSDHRAVRNNIADLMKTGCSSVSNLDEPEELPKEKHADGVCFLCKKQLRGHEHLTVWVEHGGRQVCLHHPGIRDWHRQQKHLERETKLHASNERLQDALAGEGL